MPSSPVNPDLILLDGETLRLEAIIAIARNFQPVALSPKAKERMERSRQLVEQWVREKKVIYGITTGFGSLQNQVIPPEEVEQLQENILLSHAAGVGVSPEELASVRERACALPWIEVRKSTCGKGLHLYAHVDVPTENHTVHAALARSVLAAMSVPTTAIGDVDVPVVAAGVTPPVVVVGVEVVVPLGATSGEKMPPRAYCVRLSP